MNWYLLSDLQRLAMEKGKFVCGWRPTLLAHQDLEGRFIHDPSGRRRDYEKHSRHAIMVVCEKTGAATIRYPDKPEGGLRAELVAPPK
jgi:hypothetical protein